MNVKTVLIAAAAASAVLSMASLPARAQSFSEPQKTELQGIIDYYLIKHPEVLQEAMAELEKKQQTAETEKARAAVKKHAQALFSSPRQVVMGNAPRRRHAGRVLRLQLRLLQARPDRPAADHQ